MGRQVAVESGGFPNPFGPGLFAFLRELAENNEREWFQRNKGRYEEEVKEPALAFIGGFGPHLRAISPHFVAIPKAQGGSLFRIHRDTRFSADKTPYKTHVGLHFRHAEATHPHTPAFYLHLQPGSSFVGVGLWRPDSAVLRRVREAMVADPQRWTATKAAFEEHFEVMGDQLKKAPQGFPADHPLVDDLRRKDLVGVLQVTDDEVLEASFPGRFVATCRRGAPLVAWLCGAVGAPF